MRKPQDPRSRGATRGASRSIGKSRAPVRDKASAASRATVRRDYAPVSPPSQNEPVSSSDDRIVNFNQRLREKKSYRRRVLLKKAAVAMSAVLMLGLLVWLFVFSSVFRFSLGQETILGVNGNSLIKQEDVRAVLEEYDGTPLVFLSPASVQEQLESIPEVKEAHVRLRFPRGLKVELLSHTPFVCWSKGYGCTMLAEDGSELADTASKQEEVPRLSVEDLSREPQSFMGTISEIYHQLDPTVQSQIKSMALSESGQLSFVLENGAEVLWGTDDEGELKMQVLSVLLKEGWLYCDVSIPSAPVAQ